MLLVEAVAKLLVLRFVICRQLVPEVKGWRVGDDHRRHQRFDVWQLNFLYTFQMADDDVDFK